METKNYYIGIDIGGTNIKYLLREKNNVILSNSYKTNKLKTQKEFLDFIDSIIEYIILKYKKENIKGIGIGSKSKITEDGTILSESLPMLNNLNIIKIVEEKYNIKTKIVNDACLPYYFIKDKLVEEINNKTILIVTLGTGIGTSIWNKNKQIGNGLSSSKFSHTNFREGIIENYSSTKFLIEKSKEHQLEIKKPIELFNLAKNEDDKNNKISKKIFEEYGNNIGEIISILINSNDINEIYLSGGITNAKELFLENVKTSLKKYSNNKIPNIKIIESQNNKYEIGAYGASILAEEK